MKIKKFLLATILLCKIIAMSHAAPSFPFHGHWSGHAATYETSAIEFDIYEAPCTWEQANQLPFLSQQSDGRIDVISHNRLPDRFEVIELFPFLYDEKTYYFSTEQWKQKILAGSVINSHGNRVGNFSFTKTHDAGIYPYCFHKGIADVTPVHEPKFSIPIYNLQFSRRDETYCCDKKSFSSCTLSSTSCQIIALSKEFIPLQLEGKSLQQHFNPIP